MKNLALLVVLLVPTGCGMIGGFLKDPAGAVDKAQEALRPWVATVAEIAVEVKTLKSELALMGVDTSRLDVALAVVETGVAAVEGGLDEVKAGLGNGSVTGSPIGDGAAATGLLATLALLAKAGLSTASKLKKTREKVMPLVKAA